MKLNDFKVTVTYLKLAVNSKGIENDFEAID